MQRKLLHVLAFVLILTGSLTFVWWLQGNPSESFPVLTIGETIAKLERGEFREARLQVDSGEFTDAQGRKFVTNIGNDATHELLVTKIIEFNNSTGLNTNPIKFTEEPVSAPFSWILLRSLPFLLLFTGIGLAFGLFLSGFVRK